MSAHDGKAHLFVVVVVKEPRGSINLPLKHPHMAQCTSMVMCRHAGDGLGLLATVEQKQWQNLWHGHTWGFVLADKPIVCAPLSVASSSMVKP